MSMSVYQRRYELEKDLGHLQAEQAKILSEFSVHKWILRILTPFVLASLIFGAYTFKDLVDDSVTKRMRDVDKLFMAISQAQNEQWENALDDLNELRKRFRNNPSEYKEEFRNIVYESMLWVLQNTPRDINGNWIGVSVWKSLQQEKLFLSYLLDTDPSHDYDIRTMNASCKLKYDPSKETLNELESTYNKALEYLEKFEIIGRHTEIAHILFFLALVDLVNNKMDGAVERLQTASQIHPEVYRIEDWKPYKNSYIYSAEFAIWEYVDSVINAPSDSTLKFGEKLNKAYTLAESRKVKP